MKHVPTRSTALPTTNACDSLRDRSRPAIGLFLAACSLALFSASSHGQGVVQDSLLGFDIQPGPAASQCLDLTASNGSLFFLASEVPFERQLWTIDVAGAGATLVAEPLTVASLISAPQWLTDVGGTVFFAASDSGPENRGRELWKTDGTPGGTVVVADIADSSFSSSPNHLVEAGGVLFFTANDIVNGRELWKSDGTPGGTLMVADIRPGAEGAFTPSSFPVLPTDVDGTLFFFADDGTNGCELWKSDGTPGGTSLVANIHPTGSSGPRPLNPKGQLSDRTTGVSFNGMLFFLADDGTRGVELWKSDGTNTSLVRDFYVGPLSGGSAIVFSGMVELDGFLYFAAAGSQLWRTDGSSAGTTMVTNFPGASLGDILVYEGQLIFNTGAGLGTEKLWTSDGTLTQEILPIGGAEFVEANGLVFFEGDDGGIYGGEIWLTNGDPAGTLLAADVFEMGDSFARELVEVDGALFFIADDEDIGREVHVIAPPPPTANKGGNSNLRFAGTSVDPVNTFSGELFSEGTLDFDLGGPMPLILRRTYGSYLRRSLVQGDLGNNWLHNFDASMTQAGNSALYISAEGRVTVFTSSAGTWTQQDNLDTPYQLQLDAGMDAILFDPTIERILTFDFTSGGPAQGKLTQVEDGSGNAHTLGYDGVTGQLLAVTDGLGRTLTFTYNTDPQPKIAQVSDGVRSVSYQYTDAIDPENLTQVIDASGGITSFVYEDTSSSGEFGLLISKRRPELNVPFSQTDYGAGTPGAEGRVESQDDSVGNTFQFDYQGSDTIITNPLGDTRVHSHSSGGALTAIQDQAGMEFTMGSDATGRRGSLTDRLGGVTSYAYDAVSGKLITVVDAGGASTSIQYTSRMVGEVEFRDLTEFSFADGTTRRLVYDAGGNITERIDQLGNVRTATHNARGLALTETNEVGGVTDTTYAADGTPVTSTDPAGNTTTLGYDALRRLNRITYADGRSVSAIYDAEDRLVSTTGARGNAALWTYDANGNVVGLGDRLGNVTTIDYDANDRPTLVLDPLGGTTSIAYDVMGRLESRTDPNGSTTQYGFDVSGRRTSITLPGNEVVSLDYDDEGVLSSQTDPMGGTTTFVSNALGQVASSTSPLGFTRSVAYDALGRVISTTDPLGGVTTIQHDARGLVAGVTLPDNAGVSFVRNGLGRITQTTAPGGGVWRREFDSSGRSISRTDPIGRQTTFAYDARNRISLVTYPGGAGTVSLSYDEAGNLVRATGSDGTVLDFAYDANERMTSGSGRTLAYDANGQIADANGIAVARDPGGRIVDVTLAANRSLTYAYDANGRVTSVTDWNGGVTSFLYDAAGRNTKITRPNGVDTTQVWDADGRLNEISEGAISNIVLVRDGNGQVTRATRNVPEVASALNLASSASTFNAAGEASGSTYDALGRLTARGTDTFEWDLFSRLTSRTVDGSTTTATYDARGHRLSRSSAGATRDSVWNLALRLPSVSIEREAGADLRYYVHTPAGELLYSIDAASGQRAFYHFDEMGNTLFLTDDAGTVIASYAHTPYGRLISSSGAVENPFTWQGKFGVTDEGKGLFYVRARYYDSVSRRFLTRDSAGSLGPKSVNPYQYAYSNPLLFADFTGRTATRVGSQRAAPLTSKGRARDTVATHSVSQNTIRRVIWQLDAYSEEEQRERDLLFSIPGIRKRLDGVRVEFREGLAAIRNDPDLVAAQFVTGVINFGIGVGTVERKAEDRESDFVRSKVEPVYYDVYDILGGREPTGPLRARDEAGSDTGTGGNGGSDDPDGDDESCIPELTSVIVLC